MLIHSKALADKLKYVAQGAGKKSFPECHQYALLELLPDRTFRARTFDGSSHYAVGLGSAEDKSFKLDPSRWEGRIPRICFDPQRLADAFGKFNDQVQLQIDFDNLQIKAGTGKARVTEAGRPGGEFIDLDPKYIESEIPIPETLARAIGRVVWAADPKNPQAAFTGVMFRPTENAVEVCGSDSKVIAVAADADNIQQIRTEAIIPVETANVISDLFGIASVRAVKATFLITEERVYCRVDDRYFESAMIAAKPVAYWPIVQRIAESDAYEATIQRTELLMGIDFVKKYINPDFLAVFFEFASGNLVLSASHKAMGHNGQYKLAHGGAHFATEICLHQKNVEGICKNLDCNEILIRIPKENPAAVIFAPAGNDAMETQIVSSLMNPAMVEAS